MNGKDGKSFSERNKKMKLSEVKRGQYFRFLTSPTNSRFVKGIGKLEYRRDFLNEKGRVVDEIFASFYDDSYDVEISLIEND